MQILELIQAVDIEETQNPPKKSQKAFLSRMRDKMKKDKLEDKIGEEAKAVGKKNKNAKGPGKGKTTPYVQNIVSTVRSKAEEMLLKDRKQMQERLAMPEFRIVCEELRNKRFYGCVGREIERDQGLVKLSVESGPGYVVLSFDEKVLISTKGLKPALPLQVISRVSDMRKRYILGLAFHEKPYKYEVELPDRTELEGDSGASLGYVCHKLLD